MAPEDMEKNNIYHTLGNILLQSDALWVEERWCNVPEAMITLFHDLMHKEIELYVDDMITRSQTEEEHLDHLQKLFERLKKYKLRLNPNKCTFRVRSGKLLCFVVSGKGIEVDPAKVKAIQEMLAPFTEKEVRGFLG